MGVLGRTQCAYYIETKSAYRIIIMLLRPVLRITLFLFIFLLAVISGAIVYSSAVSGRPAFDGDKAFTILLKQCEFGPRPVGTIAHTATKTYLADELRKYADSVELQEFTSFIDGTSMPLTNIIARFGKTGTGSILLCAHWDTRPIADRDRDPSKRKTPIIGANDGASGVAVLLELARIFKQSPPDVPVTIVLFDGEDYGPTGDDMYLGSRYFASSLNKGTRFRFGILLDMIGDKNLGIYREANSQTAAKKVNDLIWRTAKDLGYARYFIDRTKFRITDDHVPLIEAGIPTVDIIDFDYMPWHTVSDTPDKCSSESLKIVGDVISAVVYSQ